MSLSCNYLLSESRIRMIKRLHGLVAKDCSLKSGKSINPWQSVIQMSYDIVKAHGGELRVGRRRKRVCDSFASCMNHACLPAEISLIKRLHGIKQLLT